jgi:murein DD-endopeptidase MepM/ murein hydrolase activator NlpD
VKPFWSQWRRRLVASLAPSGSAAAAAAPARCEIQWHSGGRRGRVYRLQLRRAQMTAISVAVLVYLLLLAVAGGLAPGVVGAVLGGEEYRTLAAERLSQGERLHAIEGRLEEMRSHSETLLLAVRKVAMAYDLPIAHAPSPARPALPTLPAVEGPAGAIYGVTVGQGERLRQRIQAQTASLETMLAAVRSFEAAHPEVVRETPAACPLRGDRYVLSNPFGRQRNAFTRDFAFHGGIDLAAPSGTSIRAPADGVVVFAGTYPLGRSPVWWRYGSLVAVAHGERFLTLYGHCDEIRTAVGRQVRRGEELATVGSSGWSLSPHLHYEVRKLGAGGEMVPVDPLLYILDRRWPGEERLLAQAPAVPRAGDFEPLPPGLERGSAGSGGGAGRRGRGAAAGAHR